MLSNVPQFVDIEDHIVGPLTAKQLGWLALGGIIIFLLWVSLSIVAFIFSAVFVVIFFFGLAFYRPYNQPLITFIISSISFLFKSKIYIWKRVPEKIIARKISAKEEIIIPRKKRSLNEKNVEEISKLLDVK